MTATAKARLESLAEHLDYWEHNLRSWHQDRTFDQAHERILSRTDKLNAVIDVLNSVRDIITPGWSD